MTPATEHPFSSLTPDFVINAVESQGYRCDGRLLALNSYENRVYQVGLEDQTPLIAKFYRPERWSDAQIVEEHEFSIELAGHELPVIAPLRNQAGASLCRYGATESPFRFALYPRQGGHAPEFDNLDNLLILGRLLGRIHLIGASRPFVHRPRIDSQRFGHDSVTLISAGFVPPELQASYDSITDLLLQRIDEIMRRAGAIDYIRVHGDCHAGNMLWRDNVPHLVDFDDARMAPAVQDIWMMLSGNRPRQTAQLAELLEGYNEFFDFRLRELQLIEALRTLRILYFSAWLARRWTDPAFPHSFPWFNTARYWDNHILDLREQLAALDEPPLSVM